MRSNRIALFLTLLLASGLFVACSDQRQGTGAPHELGRAWIVESASFHGNSFKEDLLNCAACHDIGSFCTKCHFNPTQTPDVRVPPGSGWVHQAPPPSHAFLFQYGDTCNTCHSLLRGFEAGPASCHDCHRHPEGWIDPTSPNFHAPSAQADLGSCRDCHGTDLMGGLAGVSCFQCHFGPGGSRQPPTVNPNFWNHDNAKISHASRDLFTAEEQGVCTTCHGLENGFTGKPKFTDCSTATCHPDFASAFHGPDPSFFAQHPARAKDNIASCQPCHDTPSPPGPAPYVPNFNGFVTAIPCRACHDQGIAHPPGPQGAPDWYIDHRSSGNRGTACAICHDVTQGRTPPLSAAPSCFSSEFDGRVCHANGPGTAPHPVDGSYLDPAKHGADAKGDPGLVFCQSCHATPASGRSPAPRFNVTIGQLPAGCETCHNDLTAHPSQGARDTVHWYGSLVTHKDAQNLANSCALCHGADLEGDVGRACTSCHTAGSPLTLTNCTSCHASPPNSQPADTAPNRQGAHDTHNQLPEVAGVCNTCHNGGGTGTVQHFNDQRTPFLAILSDYNAQTGGPAQFTVGTNDGGTCSGVSCHGGQTTPDWLTGSINLNTDCTKCHVAETARTQYNSAVSGEHDLHVNQLQFGCTVCHNAGTLQPGSSHFSTLKTPEMEGPASATIGGGTTLVNTYDAGTKSCTPACHATMAWTGD